mmetsp:Transcript_14829/g.37011  ORF Transcript_14829/g.37011 Transcript_14829/m.37011 type:complete len:86 (-) Transcript_14829:4224-4481(-)
MVVVPNKRMVIQRATQYYNITAPAGGPTLPERAPAAYSGARAPSLPWIQQAREESRATTAKSAHKITVRVGPLAGVRWLVMVKVL